MKVKELYYPLPKELIAQYPAEKRESSRLMILDRQNHSWKHQRFYELPDYLVPGDVLILNNTKVIRARLIGRKVNSHKKIEVLLVKKLLPNRWEVLVKPGKNVTLNTRIIFGKGDLEGEVIAMGEMGKRVIEFSASGAVEAKINQYGIIPLPPYIKRPNSQSLDLDLVRYQTVYAKIEGSIAAPTAGLHFAEDLLKKIKEKGVQIVFITLHIGPGSFRPIKNELIEQHRMEPEYFRIEPEVANIIRYAKANKRRVIAVGTSVTKALETIFNSPRQINESLEGWTDLFIYPGYRFKVVDALITNFHLPGSTLLALVAAFAGRELILNAYEAAIEEKYRFYSYGDAMLII
jgi:S-adenosylmethionine:tRNA ribosyltransferase-isomerase